MFVTLVLIDYPVERLRMIKWTKKKDDRKRLKPVYGKYVLFQLVSKVNNSS